MRLGIVTSVLGVVALSGIWLMTRRGDAAPIAVGPRGGAPVPVVVELFSSEGCSSCPPADAYAAALDRDQPVAGVTAIVLEENVDYWDRLGWRDPFGSPAFSARQGEYARVLANHQVFTPEIVFDGRVVMSGDDEAAARAMQKAASEAKANVSLRREGQRVLVNVSNLPNDVAPGDVPEVWLAVTESGLATDVKAGENVGRRLVHAPVVRRLTSLGRIDGATFHGETPIEMDRAWNPSAVRVVAFVQLAGSRTIVGAAAL